MNKKITRLTIALTLSALLAATLPVMPMVREAKASTEGLTYRIAPTKYETDEYIVSGLFINDLDMDGNGEPDVTGDGVTDVTPWFQGAMDYLRDIGGGTLFVPEGRYVISGTLTIPEGVILAGDWKAPDEEGIHGTVLMAYSGRGSAESEPFISVRQNAQIRDLNIWYPEQTADDITVYPASIRLNDPSQWGAESTEVRNVTFVNSYYAIQQGPKINGCPNVRNVYGTPLYMGINMDGIADVGRFENISFSPEYWEKSGLPGAPSQGDMHRDYIYNNAVAVSLARIDWSYLCHLNVDGYMTGIEMRHSTCEGSVDENGNIISYSYPNGQIYDVSINNGQYGFFVEGCSSAGEVVSRVSIDGCETGIETQRVFGASGGSLQISDISITDTQTAVKHDGYMRFMLQDADIESGDINVTNGTIGIFDSKINSDVILDGLAEQAMLCADTFIGSHGVYNNSGCSLTEDREQVKAPDFGDFPDTSIRSGKPARAEIYVVTEDPYNAPYDGTEDASAAIQHAIDDAYSDGGGIVFCPPGNYVLKNQLTVYEGVELRGAIDKMRMPINIGTIFNPEPGVVESIFRNNFNNAETRTQNGVPNCLSPDPDGFGEVCPAAENKNVTVTSDKTLRFYTEADSEQAHIYNRTVRWSSGEDDSVYYISVDVKLASIKDGGEFYMVSYNDPDQTDPKGVRLATFRSDGTVNCDGSKALPYELGSWYKLEWKLDLRDTDNKTMCFNMYSSKGKLINTTGELSLPAAFNGNDAPMGRLLMAATKRNSGEGNEATEVFIDNVVIRKDSDIHIPIILEANSGIRGIVFDELGQSCIGNPNETSYMVQAQGENVYAINVSLRNVYNGLDFFTYKCDNHLIDGLCGFAWNNHVRIGGNSENGRLFNCHFNWGPLFYGEQSKYLSWPNSPTPEERSLYQDSMQSYLAQNLDCIIIGDCSDEILYNNFSIFGRRGLYLKDDGDGGPSGKILGHGVDGSRVCIYTDTPTAGMSLLNTQLVSYKDGESAHIVTADSFGGTLTLINTSLWSSPDINLISNGGAINMYNVNFYSMGTVFAKPDGGDIYVTNGYLNNTGTLYEGRGDKLYLKNLIITKSIADPDILGSTVNVVTEAGRNDRPKDVTIGDDEVFIFAEGFTDYPVTVTGGVINALGRTTSFSYISGMSETSNITRVEENGNYYARLYSSGTGDQAFLQNQSIYLESGKENSRYTIQARVKIDSVKTGGSFYMLLNNMTDQNTTNGSIRMADFSNGSVAVADRGSRLEYEFGKWYRCVWKLDMTDITEKSITMYLYSDDGELLGQSQTIKLSDAYQNGNAMGYIQANTNKSSTGLEDEETVAFMDYLVVSGEKAAENTSDPIPTPTPTPSPSPLYTPMPTPIPTETPEGITDTIASDGCVTVKAKLDDVPAQAILAIFNDGIPVYIAARDCAESGINEIIFDDIVLADNVKDYEIKAYIWDSLSGMSPVHKIVTMQ